MAVFSLTLKQSIIIVQGVSCSSIRYSVYKVHRLPALAVRTLGILAHLRRFVNHFMKKFLFFRAGTDMVRAPFRAPLFLLVAAAAVVVAAVIAVSAAVVASAAQEVQAAAVAYQEYQDDDPPDVTAAETVVTAHIFPSECFI